MDEEKVLNEVTEQIGKLGTTLEETRKDITKLQEDRGNLKTEITSELEERQEKIVTDLVPLILESQQIDALIKSTDEMRATINRMNEEDAEKGVKVDDRREAIRDWMRHGLRPDGISADRGLSDKSKEYFDSDGHVTEQRKLQEDTDWKGGVFVTPELTTEVLKLANDENPLIPLCRNISLTMTNSITFKKRTSRPKAYRTGEGASGTKSQSEYGDQTITAHNVMVETSATRDILADVSLMESFITEDAGEAIGLKMGDEIIDGSAGAGLEGITINADIGTVTAAESTGYTNKISPTDFASMYVDLKTKYRAGSTWVFNSSTLGAVMKMRDDQGGFLWQQTLVNGPQSVVIGRPYVICEDIDSEGDGTNPVFLGDWTRAYFVVNRTPIEVIRDPYSDKPNVEFMFIARNGGAIVTAEAVKKLDIVTT